MLPEEIELTRLETEQATLEDQVATAELTLETIKTESAQIEYRYYQSVGRLYVDLDGLEALIARVEADQDPENEEVQEQAEVAKEQAEKSAEEAGITEKKPSPPPKITPEIKKSFRQAAKLMHPDRATTEAEREHRNIIMAKVNVAYSKGDKTAIEKLITEFGQDPEAITGNDIGARMVKTIRRIAQLRRRLEESELEINRQKESEMYELFITVTEAEAMGGAPLADLARQIMQQISERKIYLEMLREKNRILMIEENQVCSIIENEVF